MNGPINAIFAPLQVASLAIASANGLLMKGGKEATHTNNLLMSIVKEGLGAYGCADSISLVSTREDIADLLKMDQVRFLTSIDRLLVSANVWDIPGWVQGDQFDGKGFVDI